MRPKLKPRPFLSNEKHCVYSFRLPDGTENRLAEYHFGNGISATVVIGRCLDPTAWLDRILINAGLSGLSRNSK